MSYELFLFRLLPGADAQDLYNQCLASQEDELNPGPLVAAVEREKHRLAKLLMQFDANLHVAEFDFEGLAQMQNIAPDEARRRYRHIELNSDDYTGIQVALWDDHAEVTFPYWHSGEQSAAVLGKVWDHLEVLAVQGGFSAYDPQLDRVLDLAQDFSQVLAGYNTDASGLLDHG